MTCRTVGDYCNHTTPNDNTLRQRKKVVCITSDKRRSTILKKNQQNSPCFWRCLYSRERWPRRILLPIVHLVVLCPIVGDFYGCQSRSGRLSTSSASLDRGYSKKKDDRVWNRQTTTHRRQIHKEIHIIYTYECTAPWGHQAMLKGGDR